MDNIKIKDFYLFDNLIHNITRKSIGIWIKGDNFITYEYSFQVNNKPTVYKIKARNKWHFEYDVLRRIRYGLIKV